MADLLALKAELLAGHPDTGAYDADDLTAANQINVVNRSRNRNSISGDEIFNAAEVAELAALASGTSAQKQLFQMFLSLCGRDSIDPFGAANVRLIQEIFGAGSSTITALAALRTEPVSRADELGLGRVREGTVAAARAS